MTLDSIREQIDDIDGRMAALFQKRMELAKQVAGVKLLSGDAVYKPQREGVILDRIASGMPEEIRCKGRSLFTSIVLQSREIQYEHLLKNGKKVNCIDRFYPAEDLVENTVAYYGDECSWSHLAAKKMSHTAQLVGVPTFDAVFDMVASGQADAGVIPVENSTAGTVREVYDLLLGSGLYISYVTELDIEYCLAAKTGTKIEDIKSVYSHPQSLSQCKNYLKLQNYEPVAYPNTAGAAKYISQKDDHSLAALCNVLAVENYGLVALQSGIRDSKLNTTRFIKIIRQPAVPEHADTVSMALTIDDRAGILANAAAMFKDYGINLHKIESRPIPDTPYEYSLYVDFVGSLFDQRIRSLLLQFEEEFKDVCVFGNYKSI